MVKKMIWTVVGFFKNGRTIAPNQLEDDLGGLSFEPEPTNAYDPDAVKVLLSGVHVAYVSREDAKEAKAFLASTNHYTVKVKQTFGASALIEVDTHNPYWPLTGPLLTS
jgi:hypothetical protein